MNTCIELAQEITKLTRQLANPGIQWVSVIAACFAALFGGFSGAWFAYFLKEKQDRNKHNKEQIAAIKKAQFVLVRQMNNLLMMQQLLDEYRESPIRQYAMPSLAVEHLNEVYVDVESLLFMLDYSCSKLLTELFVSQDRYVATIAAHKIRSKFCLEQLQPELARLNLVDRSVRKEDFDKLGVQLTSAATQCTDSLYAHVDDTLATHECIVGDLFNCAKKIYPNNSFVKFEYANN